MFKSKSLWIAVLLFALSPFILASAQEKPVKCPLSHEDYDAWKSIGSTAFSVTGQWVLYLETPQDGEAEIVVKHLQTEKEFRHAIGYTGEGTEAERAANPAFSFDETHAVFLISPTQEEVKKAKKEKKTKEDMPKKKLGIMDMLDGRTETIERVKSFALAEEAGGWVAYLKEAPPKKKEEDKPKDEEKKEPSEEKKPEKKPEEKQEEDKKKEKKKDFGTELILRSLADGTETSFESVMDYRLAKKGESLLYTVSSKEKPETDGLYYYEPQTGLTKTLLAGKGHYKRWAMDKKETRLAILTDRDDFEADEPTFNLYGWNAGGAKAELWVSHQTTPGFPQGMAVSDKSEVSFSEDGRIVMLGIKEIPEPKKKKQKKTEEAKQEKKEGEAKAKGEQAEVEAEEKGEEEEEEEEAKLDLWHWNDPYPQPQQKKMAERMRDNTWESVYDIDTQKLVKLADEDIPDVRLSRDGKIAWAEIILPYTKLVSWDGSYYDIYVIDPKSGKKTLVKEKIFRGASLSPGGRFIDWFDDGHWFVYDIAKGETKNITTSLDVRFDIEDWDTPSPPYPYGTAGWTDGDGSILVYDRFDIWEIKPDGSQARMITEGFGRRNHISFRYMKLDPEEQTINPKKPLLLRALDEETMAQGFYRDRVQGQSPPEKLMMADKAFLSIRKAKNADVMMYSQSSFDEFPDLWVTNLEFVNPKKVTDLGKQMEPFLWGKAELRAFQSADGKPLNGILIKPDDFDPNKKYPLMVYIYETLHQMIHYFRSPSPGTSINFPYYVSNGYVLWMPDIEYDTGYPGQDALKCVLPGIQMLVREGYINPEAIGIQGHSWGGYQISYMVTQTNIFAAAEAGAPVSNMVSAYGGIRWGSGMVRQFQYERTQSRLGASLWEVPMRFLENSPIFWADKIETPLLIIHNDNDGAVPWYQGIELIMALRRLGKEAYMFNYLGEDHGLRKRVNREDWTIRMQEFFDHHLKGAPMPDWMKEGIKAWDKKEKKEEKE